MQVKFKGEGDSVIWAKFVKNFEVWNNYEDYCHLGCNAVLSGRIFYVQEGKLLQMCY
jgi:hypothetical protein